MAKKRQNATHSPNYTENIYHYRRLVHLHFDLDLPLYPFCFEDQIRDLENAWFESPGDNFMMLVALEDGESTYDIEGEEYVVTPGKVLFVPEFVPYRFRSDGYQHKYVLEIKGSNLSSILSSLRLERTSLHEIDDFKAFVKELTVIGQHVDTSDEETYIAAMGQCYHLLARLALRKVQRQPTRSSIAHILGYLEKDLEKRLSIADVVKKTGMSKATLIRLVKKHTGLTPMQYRISRKIERATYYLQLPEMAIKEIAYRLGFCNQFYFAEQFRKVTGKTPTYFREYQKMLASKH